MSLVIVTELLRKAMEEVGKGLREKAWRKSQGNRNAIWVRSGDRGLTCA